MDREQLQYGGGLFESGIEGDLPIQTGQRHSDGLGLV